MKAIVQDRYGPPGGLRLCDVDRPVPGPDEILVRVRAASVNAAELHLMRGDPYIARLMGIGLFSPRVKIRGRDLAGVVEATGGSVRHFHPGDEVYGETPTGSFAEYALVPAGAAAPKPVSLTFEQAAAVPLAGVTALQGLRDLGKVQPGQRVLINGASGGVGTFAVQLAVAFRARVTGVCSTRNIDLVRSLGAAHVIDYTRQDFTTDGRRYDVVFDLVANRSLADLRRAVTPAGALVLCGGNGSRWLGPIGMIVQAHLRSRFTRQRLCPLVQKQNSADLATLTALVDSGQVVPSIERTLPLSEAAEAIRHLEDEHARSKIVITV